MQCHKAGVIVLVFVTERVFPLSCDTWSAVEDLPTWRPTRCRYI